MKEIKSLDIMSTGKLYAGVCAFLYGIIAVVYGLVLIGILATRGIAFMILGLTNKDKWKKHKPLSKLSKQQRTMKIYLIIGLLIGILVGLVVFYIKK